MDVLYPDIRRQLVSGHVVTFEGSDMLSRAIRWFAPGGSHTAMRSTASFSRSGRRSSTPRRA